MPASSASVKLKRLRQRFGISAPRVAVRTHVAWYWRALAMGVVLSFSFAAAAWIYDAGRSIAGYDSDESAREIQSLRNHVMELDAELTKLRGLAGSGESSLQIERAAQRQLSRQVKALEQENEALKQDLAFFEGILPSSGMAGEEAGVKIDRLRIEPDAKRGDYRYRMLVVNSGGKQGKEFKGVLQLVLKVQRGGKDAMIMVPSDADPNPQRYRIEIKNFHRLEGGFSVPDDVAIQSVEARLVQDGVVRARQVATL